MKVERARYEKPGSDRDLLETEKHKPSTSQRREGLPQRSLRPPEMQADRSTVASATGFPLGNWRLKTQHHHHHTEPK